MTIIELPYTGATAGAVIAPGTFGHTTVQGGGGGTFVDVTIGGVVYKFLRFNPAGSATSIADVLFPAATTQFSIAMVARLDSGSSAAAEVWNGRVGADGITKMSNLLTSTADTMQFRQNADGAVVTSTALTEATLYLVQMALQRGTTTANGKIRYRITPLAGGTALVDYSGDAANLGTADFTGTRWGDLTSAAVMDMLVGRVRIATGTDALDGGALKFIDPYTVTPATQQLRYNNGTTLQDVYLSLWNGTTLQPLGTI